MAKSQKKSRSSRSSSEPVNNSQPYDTKAFEKCPTCEDSKMFYRKRKLFDETIYYILCNECGDYKTISKEEYLEKVSAATQSENEEK